MNAAELVRLRDLIEEDMLPLWLKSELETNAEDIVSKLENGIPVTFEGPEGQEITIEAEKKKKHAAA